MLLPCLFLAALGFAGDIQVFLHVAAFTSLPLLIWMLVGNQVARVIWFPLCFILFAIPIGEELVPTLQKVTADMAIALLNLTSIPSYNTGLYIEIPEGKFVVAEACSGIRFFIGSIVFGAVYSHISYQSFKRKLVFMCLAVFIPVLANAIRVFTIVLIGHYVDMEYASGADHLIYGWVFFAIVLFLLILIGESFREKAVSSDERALTEETGSVNSTLPKWEFSKAAWSIGVVCLFSLWAWKMSFQAAEIHNLTQLNRVHLAELSNEKELQGSWSPSFNGATDLYQASMKGLYTARIDLVIAWYPENREGRELISSLNTLYDKDQWSLVGQSTISIENNGPSASAILMEITSARGEKRWIVYWYQLDEQTLASAIKAKIYQSLDVMFAGEGAGAMILLSTPFSNLNKEQAKTRLIEFAAQNKEAIRAAIPFDQ